MSNSLVMVYSHYSDQRLLGTRRRATRPTTLTLLAALRTPLTEEAEAGRRQLDLGIDGSRLRSEDRLAAGWAVAAGGGENGLDHL